MTSPTAHLGPHTINRVGYGAMQLPGPGVMGPPRDHEEAIAVIRRAREHGVDHIDTAGFYGPAEHVLLIPGTGSLAHLEENLGAGELALDEEHMGVLDGIAA